MHHQGGNTSSAKRCSEPYCPSSIEPTKNEQAIFASFLNQQGYFSRPLTGPHHSSSTFCLRRRGDRMTVLTSEIVEGFGCRPATSVRHTPVAGVRKPPRKEPAGDGARVCRVLRGGRQAAIAIVEGFGCRPATSVRHTPVAGVRNPQQNAKFSTRADVFRSSTGSGH